MRAVRIHEYGGPETLVYEDNVPDPRLSPNAVVIETVATSVNPIDWKIRSGARRHDFPMELPAILGRDVSGVVVSVGSSVRDCKVGDRVMALSEFTYAELVVVESNAVTHIPHGLDAEDAAAIPLVVLTGDQLVRLAARVVAGQTVVVTGALGSVGRAAVHSANKVGARVIAGVRHKDREAAALLDVAGVVAIDDDAQIAALSALDCVADTVGGDTAVKLLAKVKPGGTFGYASALPTDAANLHSHVSIVRVFAKPDPSKVREFADDVRDGKFVLPIGHRLPLRDAAEGHRLGEKGGAGKILLLRSSP